MCIRDSTYVRVWNPFLTTGAGDFRFVTRDIFNDSVGQRKKVYKVYITYKCQGDSKIHVEFITDGKRYNVSGNHKDFTAESNYSVDSTFGRRTLDSTSNEWVTAELTPENSSDTKNIKSFSIVFQSQGNANSSFAINDISVVYRVKNVK